MNRLFLSDIYFRIVLKGKQKKIPKGFLERRTIWEKNHNELLEIISSKKYPLNEIVSKSSIEKTAVLKHVKKMIDDNLIEIIRDNGKSYYVLTEKGNTNLMDILAKHQETISGLKDTGHTYFSNRSELGITMTTCRLPWGIDPHMTINTKLEKLKLLDYADIEEMEKLLYKKIAKNIKNIREHGVKFRSDALDLLDKEKFVLSFNIDLLELHESIEQKSLETLENMPEEEITARFQAELDWMENIDDF